MSFSSSPSLFQGLSGMLGVIISHSLIVLAFSLHKSKNGR